MSELELKLPDIGEGVTEGEIVQWFVSPGDTVAEDDPLVEVMTDKATVQIGAPCDARVDALCVAAGEVARVGQVLVRLQPTAPAAAGPSEAPAATAVGEISHELPGAALFASRSSSPSATSAPGPLASPATRRLAMELGVDLHRVRGSGDRGRITDDDVRAAARGEGPQPPAAPGLERREPLRGIRRAIAERMHRATQSAAHFTFVEECDAGALLKLRERLRPEAERHGTRLTLLPFVVKAVADALPRHPKLNASLDERTHEVVYKERVHVGIATATEAGLLVPVVHDADALSLFDVAARIEALAAAAREGRLRPEELRGSTFTITSLGKRSGLLATPILNHPEVGILGVHRIKERPVVRDGEIVVGHVMLLSLSFDHRLVDGHVGADFAYDVIETLENPERLWGELR